MSLEVLVLVLFIHKRVYRDQSPRFQLFLCCTALHYTVLLHCTVLSQQRASSPVFCSFAVSPPETSYLIAPLSLGPGQTRQLAQDTHRDTRRTTHDTRHTTHARQESSIVYCLLFIYRQFVQLRRHSYASAIYPCLSCLLREKSNKET